MEKVQGTSALAAVFLLALASGVSSDSWAWPNSKREVSSVVSIGTKIDFEDSVEDGKIDRNRTSTLQEPQSDQSDDIPPLYNRGRYPDPVNGPNEYVPSGDTQGFYSRAPTTSGKYQIGAINYALIPERIREEKIYRVNAQGIYPVQSIGSGARRFPFPSDSNANFNYPIYNIENCKCVRSFNCPAPAVIYGSCAPGKSYCCLGSPKSIVYQNQNVALPPDVLVGPGGFIGSSQFSPVGRPNSVFVDTHENNVDSNRGVLVGPNGPTGVIGPGGNRHNKGLLVGPEGPTGIIGPAFNQNNGYVPGSSNILRPNFNNGVLVGPGGPTGSIGPGNNGVLVGPGGPTGIIGPSSQGVLVGPGGPTGIIGPANSGFVGPNRRPSSFIRNQAQGILVGPGGPTGIIGPGYTRRY